MSQKSVPIADVGTPTGWSTPVWSKTNALKSGDPDYTASSSDPAGDTFVVQLGAFGVPPPAARPFRVHVRSLATAGGTLLVTLLQGDTVIASRVLTPGTSFEDEPFDLTDTEIGRIDYATLGTTTFKLECRAFAPPITLNCSAFAGADHPSVYLTFLSSPPSCLCNWAGLTGELTYNSSLDRWVRTSDTATCSTSGGTAGVQLQCTSSTTWTSGFSFEPTGGPGNHCFGAGGTGVVYDLGGGKIRWMFTVTVPISSACPPCGGSTLTWVIDSEA